MAASTVEKNYSNNNIDLASYIHLTSYILKVCNMINSCEL